ncbi:MAG: PAS domain S-box protein [Acidobacteriota bacterium]|jgi:PAS domain S-box-containing protein
MINTDTLKRYLDQAEVIIIVLDLQGNVRFINRKGCATLGYEEDQIVGRNWFDDFIPMRIQASVRSAFRRIIDGENPGAEFFENPVLTGLGQEKLVAWRNALIRDKRGRLLEILSTGEDVTQRRRTEAALSESEATLRAILDTCVDGIITIDAQSRILSFNPAAVRIFGYQPEEVIGEAVSILMPEPYQRQHSGYVDHFLKTRQTQIIGRGREVVGRRKDGSTFPLYLAVSDVNVRGRKIFTGIARDLTDFKKMQEEMIHAQKLAAIGEMAASVGHEIKNPLAGIGGAIEILKDTLDAGDARRQVMDDILSEVKRLDNTVRDLLAFSRPWNPDLQICQLEEVAERVARTFREQEDLTRVRFVFGSGTETQAHVDPWLFEKVLWNILDNANDAMGGEGEVHFTFDSGPGYVEMTVTDSGAGMSPELLKDIFRPFFTTKNRGTGLGLAICKKILDAHGGSISISSQLQKGTRVRIRVPASANTRAGRYSPSI